MHLRELDANLIVILDALLIDASVTKAAERLGRSPSAVSHALARLREVFDDPLFVRAGQRLVPTSRATQLAPTVHIIVSGLEGLLYREDAFDPQAHQRSFALACSDLFELTALPGLRTELADLAPGITLTRNTPPGGGSIEALRRGQVDIAVIENPEAAPANDISAETLYQDACVLVAPARHPLARVRLTRRHLIAGGPSLIVAEERLAETLLNETGLDQAGQLLTASSVLIALHTALARDALALVPSSLSRIAQRDLGMITLETTMRLPSVQVDLMWHLSVERDPCHTWLRDLIRQQAGALSTADRVEADGVPA